MMKNYFNLLPTIFTTQLKLLLSRGIGWFVFYISLSLYIFVFAKVFIFLVRLVMIKSLRKAIQNNILHFLVML